MEPESLLVVAAAEARAKGASGEEARGDEARRGEVQYRVSVRGALCLSSSLFKPLQRRYTVHIANRDINPGYVGAMHCCKAPLWGRRLDLDSLNLTPRFAHRLLLLLWLVVVKKGS